MATGTLASGASTPGILNVMAPIAITSGWVDICTDAATAESGSAVVGGIVVYPGAITRTTQNWLQMGGSATSVQVALKYPTAGTVTTNTVVQIFGRATVGGRPQRLKDSGGSHALTLTVDTTNDVQDGTFSYTEPAELDCQCNVEILVSIKTALAGTSLTGATIQIRVK